LQEQVDLKKKKSRTAVCAGESISKKTEASGWRVLVCVCVLSLYRRALQKPHC